MVALLPVEILQTVAYRYPCRDSQIQSLATLYNDIFPVPRTLIIYGLEGTHKLEVTAAVLEARSLKHIVVKCQDCLSQRHLFTKIFGRCLKALGVDGDAEQYDKIENISSLAVALEKLFRKRDAKLIFLLDGVDKQRGASQTLLPALSRLGDMIPEISVIMTSESPRPLHLHKSGIPYIYFSPYSRAEAVSLVTQGDPPVPDKATNIKSDDMRKIYVQFAVTIYDSLISATASTSVTTFCNLCEKLWPRFIWPAFSGETTSGKSKSSHWDFARLLIRNRALFQSEGEMVLLDRLKPLDGPWTFEQLEKASEQQQHGEPSNKAHPVGPTAPSKRDTRSLPKTNLSDPKSSTSATPSLLKYFPTMLILSAYLASHTVPKNDIIIFSRLSSSTKRSRKNRTPKKSIFKSPSSKSTSITAKSADSGAGGTVRITKNMQSRIRTLFDLKFGAPKAFALERLIAILGAVHPDGFKRTRGIADRVYREMGELERLRLVERVGTDEEVAVGGGRWKIAVGREVVEGMLKGWEVNGGIAEWELQQDK